MFFPRYDENQQKSKDKLVDSMKTHLSRVKYMSCTADIWSRDMRSYIAMNSHWIDNNGSLKSALLACERFRGSHTGDEVAKKLKGICFYCNPMTIFKFEYLVDKLRSLNFIHI